MFKEDYKKIWNSLDLDRCRSNYKYKMKKSFYIGAGIISALLLSCQKEMPLSSPSSFKPEKAVYSQNDISEKGLIFSKVHLLMREDLRTTVLYQMELLRGLHLEGQSRKKIFILL